MKEEFIRTGNTKLTDDELILFDALFDCGCPFEFLRKEKFSESLNFSYEHDLSDESLKTCLENLLSQKLIKLENSFWGRKLRSYYYLTAKGGKLWEKEREPIWSKYCVNLCDHLDKNKRIITVTSPSLETLKKYLKVAKELNLNELTGFHEISFKVKHRKFIEGLRWKRFDEVHIASIKGWQTDEDAEKWHKVDWDYYYKIIDWWDNVRELNILNQKNIS